MKTFFKVVALVCAVVMLATMFVGCGEKKAKNNAANNTVFKIGVSGPLTGGAAMYGNAVVNAAKMAVEEINAAGGVFGTNFELLTYDDQHDPTKVATGYASMYEDGMQVSLGCVTTKPCLEFKTLSSEDNVFFITPSASGDAVPENANAYQMCFADGNQGAAAAKFVKDNYAGQTIGVLYCAGDDYSQGIYEQFKDNIGTAVTLVTASFTNGATDFASQIAVLKDCKFVFLPIYYDPASQFMLQAKNTENNMEVFYGCDGLDGIDAIDGFDISKIPQEVSYLSHFNANSDDAAVKKFVDAYKAKYGEVPSQFAAAAYDCVYAIYNAMVAAGKDKLSVTMSAEELCAVLKTQFDGNFTYSGVTGKNMTWNKAGNNGFGYVQKDATKFIVKEKDAE